jgi:hypothetical protein
MAAPITSISPLPFLGFTVAVTDAAVVDLDPQPFNNTKEIILLNLSETDQVYVQVADLAPIQASATITVQAPGFPLANTPVAGDIITIMAIPLTAVAGVPGVDEFSAPVQATATITVGASPLAAGDTITLLGVFPGPVALTGVLGPRGAGTLDFQVDAGSAILIASSIVAAINDPAVVFGGFATNLFVASNVGGTSATVTLVSNSTGASPNPVNQGWRLVSATTPAGNITPSPSPFTGGVDAEPSGGDVVTRAQDPADFTVNSNGNIARNIINAINALTNSFTALVRAYTNDPVDFGSSAVIQVVAVPPGAAGNGIPLTENTAGQIVVDPATTGGADASPVLTAANSVIIPPASAITLAIGSEGNRQPLATEAFWMSNPGSKLGVVLTMAPGSDPADVNVTYVQNRGYPEGV